VAIAADLLPAVLIPAVDLLTPADRKAADRAPVDIRAKADVPPRVVACAASA
jgi:hypothetical protein